MFGGGGGYGRSEDEATCGPLVTGAGNLDSGTLGEFLRNERLMEWIVAWIHHGYLFVPE